MKNVLYILVCLGMASMASALSITNGDFEKQSGTANAANVTDWYDYGNSNYQAGPWFRGDGSGTINTTGCLFMSGSAADTSEDGGHKAYVYQSIGNADGTQAIDLSLQWGAASYVENGNIGNGNGGIMGLTVMILESDGTFEPGEWGRIDDIYGAGGVQEIARGTVVKNLVPGVAVNAVFTLDISSATVGKELFLRINAYNAGVNPWMSIDNIAMTVNKIVPKLPKDNARFVAVERTSSENDLVFTIADPNGVITAVDILFGPENDPNLSLNPAYKIVSGKPVSQGNQYTITLNTELAADLSNATQYYWKILAYEPNEAGLQLASTTSVWSFKTIQIGPYLGPVTPNPNGVFAGQDAVFNVFSVKADTFQWYKQGTPNIALSVSDPNYSGVNTNTLTVNNAQLDDEGFYYCVATETATGLSITSEAPGELIIKRLKHHFPFNPDEVTGDITPDTIGGVQAQLMGGASVELYEPNSIVGGYLRLDNPGTNAEDTEYANILDASVFDQRQITVSAWFRIATRSGKQPVWACGADTNNYFDFYPQYQYNEEGLDTARSEFRVSSNVRVLDGTYEMNTDQWYFVTITNSDGTVKLYIDGKYVGISDMFTMSELTKTLAYIGKRVAGVAGDYPLFNGFIDELKVYNYAMSTVEIGQAYLAVKTDVEFVCNEETYNLAAWDFDSNCRVDLADFAVIAAQWLEDHSILRN